jgi:uncharacterized repeat protein (TIGR01451 family)
MTAASQVHHGVYRAGVVVISLVLFLAITGPPATAQAPPSFEIRLLPQAAQAVAGQPFSYTVIVTNTGQSAPADILVKAPAPTGAVFQNTTYTHENWMAGGLEPGQSGYFAWLTRDPVPPGAVVKFHLTVHVLSETRRLDFSDYAVSTLADPSAVFGRGLAVTVPVLSAPPGVSAAPAPTPAPPPTPTPTLPAAAPAAARPASVAKAPAQPAAANSSYLPVIAFAGLLIMVGLFIVVKLVRRA